MSAGTRGAAADVDGDLAVVLARGRSRRMGFAKGLLRLPDDERPLLVRVVELYRGEGIPVVVVAAEAAARYREVLGEREGVEVIAGPPGGDTAHTLRLACRHTVRPAHRLWLHPVDLPLVRPQTVRFLAEWPDGGSSGLALRPTYEGIPGHPVLLPGGVLREWALRSDGLVAGKPEPEPLRCILGLPPPAGPGLEIRAVPVTDPGVVRDFDSPEPL